MNLRHRIPVGAVLCLCCALAWPVAATTTPWVPMRFGGGQVEVPSVVGGEEGWSVLDSGAALDAVNATFVEVHGLDAPAGADVSVVGAFGEGARPSFRGLDARVMGIGLRFANVVELPLGPAERQLLVGGSFFRQAILQFDGPGRRARAMTRDQLDLGALANVPVRHDPGTGRLQVRVRLDDSLDAWLLLDTGSAGGVMLERRVARQQGWLQTNRLSRGFAQGVNETVPMQAFRLPQLTIGPHRVERPLVMVPERGHAVVGLDRQRLPRHQRHLAADGVLGMAVLRAFVLTADWREGLVHLAAPTAGDAPAQGR